MSLSEEALLQERIVFGLTKALSRAQAGAGKVPVILVTLARHVQAVD